MLGASAFVLPGEYEGARRAERIGRCLACSVRWGDVLSSLERARLTDQRDYLLFHGDPLPGEYISAESGSSPTELGPLGRVNIFVGANSSGKSRFLRTLAKRNGHVLARGDEAERVRATLAAAKKVAASSDKKYLVSHNPANRQQFEVHPADFSTTAEILPLLVQGKKEENSKSGAFNRVELLASVALREAEGSVGGTKPDPELLRPFAGMRSLVNGLSRPSPPRLFVPPLRSAHTLWTRETTPPQIARLHEDVFETTARYRYFQEQSEHLDVWSGSGLYQRLLTMQCARRAEREKKLAFERFLSTTFFEGRSVELVAQLGANASAAPFDAHVNFVLDGQEYEFFNVGDGISALTTLLFPLFTAKTGTWAFIEEPETHLHPAYQRIFLEALLHDPALVQRDLRVFLTTHSNHLLDVAMSYPDDVAVFSFARGDAQKLTVRRSQGRDIRVLDALGVWNGSVFLANCSIWVEGPTDRVYIRAYLKALAAEKYGAQPFLEDLHFAFVEYGGGLIANYDFGDGGDDDRIDVAATANRVCIVADRDVGKEERHRRWREKVPGADGALGYVTTTGREIENDLSPEMVKRIVGKRLKRDDLPGAFDPMQCGLDEYMGEFLARSFESDEKAAVVRGWKAESGTLKTHVKEAFADEAERILAAAAPDERDQLLGERGRRLAEHILAFIERHNPSVAPARRVSLSAAQ